MTMPDAGCPCCGGEGAEDELCRRCYGIEVGRHRVNTLRRIVADHQYEMVEGLMVDVQSAGAMLTVYAALSPENRERMGLVPLAKYGEFCWNQVKVA